LLRYNDPEHSIESPRGHGGVLAFALRVFYGHGLVLYDFPDLVFLFVLFVCFAWKAQSPSELAGTDEVLLGCGIL
jgi:hypothetical protein